MPEITEELLERAKKVFPFHPVVEMFPLMDEGAFSEFVGSIRDNGQRQKIEIYDGQLISGRHRLLACVHLGINPEFEEVDRDGLSRVEMANLSFDDNYQRRHLTPSQQAMAAAQYNRYVNDQGLEDWVAEKAIPVSRKTLKKAEVIEECGSPRLQEAVKDGIVTVTDAERIMDVPHAEQNLLLRAVKTGECTTLVEAKHQHIKGVDDEEAKADLKQWLSERQAPCKEALKQLRTAKKGVQKALSNYPEIGLALPKTSFVIDLDSAIGKLAEYQPYKICCGPLISSGKPCRFCDNAGFVTRFGMAMWSKSTKMQYEQHVKEHHSAKK